MNKKINIALIGASGIVGNKIIKLLEARSFPINNFIPIGHSTVGEKLLFNNIEYSISSIDSFDPKNAQLIILSAGSNVANQYARDFVESGSYVIDLSSHFRYEDDVPLISNTSQKKSLSPTEASKNVQNQRKMVNFCECDFFEMRGFQNFLLLS